MKPIAFRIRDFRSISDSGVCALSGDGITVLAGQNESGKTAVLSALRDFDLPPGNPPESRDYLPEGTIDARPRVSVQFSVDTDALDADLAIDHQMLPVAVLDALRSAAKLWVTRDLLTGQYHFEDEICAAWGDSTTMDPESNPDSADESDADQAEAPTAIRILSLSEAPVAFRNHWPAFVYFDSFQDALPREILLSSLTGTAKSVAGKEGAPSKLAPQAVQDFVALSGLDLNRVLTLASDNKGLGNYLRGVGATITGDFLTYWKQTIQGKESVVLNVRHFRDESGALGLAFFVHDRVDQYPDQRSKGFLWFLSFYLRLAATHKRDRDPDRLLLIDEPGTYLHARAQKDVLHLFEDRLSARDMVIYSTHSVYLMPADRLHRLRLVVKSNADGTKVLDRLTHPMLRQGDFSDTLSPILTAVGLDITEQLSFARPRNLLVEGISDHFYLSAWARLIRPSVLDSLNIFPGSGATTLPILASLFIGWGLQFGVLLDRDEEGNKVKAKLQKDFAIENDRIAQPGDSLAIEDMFSAEDFRRLLESCDPTFTLDSGERPSAAIKRQAIDKVLLARVFAESANVHGDVYTKKTRDAFDRLFNLIETACGVGVT